MIGDQSPQLCLASTSPRRRQLLELLQLRFVVSAANVCEQVLPDEAPRDYVLRLAAAKAAAVEADCASMSMPLLGADTCVTLDNEILGKPQGPQQAIEMLHSLSGRKHEVFTAIALRSRGELYTAVSHSRVTFACLDDVEIQRYVDSGEPLDKAGAYAIQGRGATFITYIEGSYTGVVGLPLYELAQLLRKVGICA
ncbi:MAG: Maf family nucleotide pyrophosphatase [Gammaproteobacteria bacterium]|nr:Maf family nucleotide pyrophosphatase [Gammaproteobacteria bacterium]